MISEPLERDAGLLTLVPTPIGNLGDITLRALEVLRHADLILAEDTRHTGILLKHFGIEANVESYHQHNEHQKLQSISRRIAGGMHVAYCSDAGTPGISDPGFLLVRHCLQEGLRVQGLPGPTAFVPALISSGLPCDRFVFEGFLPVKKGRSKRLEALKDETRTMVFYESPYKLLKTMEQLVALFGAERTFCVARELSKIHEEYLRGKGIDLLETLRTATLKGEFVIIAAGKS